MERPLAGYAIVVTSAACFGTLSLFTKLFYQEGGEPFPLLLVRFAGAGAVLALVVLVRRRPLPSRRVLAGAIGLGLFQLATVTALFEGLARAPASLVILLFYVYPLLVTIGAVLLYGEEWSTRRGVILAVGLAGIALAVGIPSGATALGAVLGLAAGVSGSVTILGARRLLTGPLSAVELTLFVFVAPSIVLGAIAAARGLDATVTAGGWAAAAGVVVLGTVVPVVLFYTGVKLVGAGTASLLSTGEPLVAVLLAYAVLGESLEPTQLLGGALILAAVCALSVRAARVRPDVVGG